VRFDLNGLPVTFLDTAGLREAADPIERLGVARARQRAAAADLRIVMSSPDTVQAEDTDADLWRKGDIRAWSKCDLACGRGDVAISATSGAGIDALLALLRDRLSGFAGEGIISHARARLALEEAVACVGRGRAALNADAAEHCAEELRLACDALAKLIGATGVETVLDEVFGTFCLGK
jgi:tRNA modification GTPase